MMAPGSGDGEKCQNPWLKSEEENEETKEEGSGASVTLVSEPTK